MPNIALKHTLLFLCLALAAAAFGCASRFETTVSEATTLGDALFYFGTPTEETVLPDGGKRLDWTLDEERLVPGHYVTRTYRIGRDREGWPVYIDRLFWVPEQMKRDYCHMTITVDANGNITGRRWKGPSCDRLMFSTPGRSASPSVSSPQRVESSKE